MGSISQAHKVRCYTQYNCGLDIIMLLFYRKRALLNRPYNFKKNYRITPLLNSLNLICDN